MTDKDTTAPQEPRLIVQDAPFPTGIILDETNYQLWSQLMEMRIGARNKLGFLTGTSKKPESGEKQIETWLMDNNRVKSWLIDSMSPTLISTFIRLKTAKEIWDAVAKTFYDGTDETQLFELNRRSFSTKQNGRPLAAYYNELVGIFQEIDTRLMGHEDEVDKIVSLKKILGRLRVHIFLAGLDAEFNQARGEILRKDPPMDLEACYAFVRKDQQQRSTMEDVKRETDSVVNLATRSRTVKEKEKEKSSNNKKNNFVCTHCGEEGHSKQRCYELVGYPEWWDFSKRPRRKVGQTSMATTKGDDGTPVAAHTESFSDHGKPTISRFFSHEWVIDSGATDHMTNDPSILEIKTQPTQSLIKTANGGSADVISEGSAKISESMNLESILVVPSLSSSLLSVSQVIDQLNCYVSFWPNKCFFQDIATDQILGYGTRRGRLYYLEEERLAEAYNVEGRNELAWLWHRRLGHLSFGYLKRLKPELFLNNKTFDSSCDICELAKHHRVSYLPSENKTTIPFMKIHSDVWGPAKIATPSGYRYFVTFIDEFSRMIWVSLLKNKSEVPHVFKELYQIIKSQFKCEIKVLQSDNGGEYVNQEMEAFCKANSIRHQTSCANTPQQNGLAERRNKQILEIVRASLFDMKVPRQYWGEAVQSEAYLMNRTPSRVLNFKTPLQVVHEKLELIIGPNLEPRVFGCSAYVHSNDGKLEPRAKKCMFIGYADYKKGYRCVDPKSGKVYVTRDVSFHEKIPYFTPEYFPQGEKSNEGNIQPNELGPSGNAIYEDGLSENGPNDIGNGGSDSGGDGQNGSEAQTDSTPTDSTTSPIPSESDPSEPVNEPHPSEPDPNTSQGMFFNENSNVYGEVVGEQEHETPASRYPVRRNRGVPRKQYQPDLTSKSRYPINNFVSTAKLADTQRCMVEELSSVVIPKNIQDAMKHPEWRKAVSEEVDALKRNQTWEEVLLPTGKKTVGCRWVFTVKLDSNGKVARYKARLVAKGYTQKFGIDYEDTFAPVAKINTIRVLVSIAANQDWPLKQFDVKNAFLNGYLEEEVFMDPPPGMNYGGKVCKLNKALYGLKQSPRAWFGRFSKFMRKIGYKQSDADHTLFVKSYGDKVTALIVYVDDMVVTGNDPDEINTLQGLLSREFELKDLGDLRYFLGIEVARSKHGIVMCQRKYVLDLLAETGMLECQPIDTPIEVNHKLTESTGQVPTNRERYQKLVGKLIYLAHTRPDIAYAVSIVSRFMHAPSESHMKAVFRILRYLKSSPGKGLFFGRNGSVEVKGYTDSDWAGDKSDGKSTSGYFVFVGGNLVTWRSKKQKFVSRSSAEAEFRGMVHGVCELLWVKRVLKDLGINVKGTMELFCDNQAAVKIASNPVQHDRTKHVELDRHFIKDHLEKKTISLPYVNSNEQLADMLTKAVCVRIFNDSLDKLRMIDIHSSA